MTIHLDSSNRKHRSAGQGSGGWALAAAADFQEGQAASNDDCPLEAAACVQPGVGIDHRLQYIAACVAPRLPAKLSDADADR